MRRITLGQTGIVVNQLGFGGIPIQRVDELQAVQTVLHAIEKGIDFIDTSRMYTTSETRIGKALQQTSRKIVLATKSTQRKADGVRQDIDISLSQLQTDYIDIYQAHAVRDSEEYQRVIAKGGALEGLIKAKQEGLIGHVGITSHSLNLLESVIDDGLFETIMVCFSFLEPLAAEKVIPKAVKKGIGVIAMKPFSGGVIDQPALALKYVLAQSDVLVLAGVEEKALFDRNWQVFENFEVLTSRELEQIEVLRGKHAKTFCRRCDYCQPCSQQIPIQYVLGIRSLVKRGGLAALIGPMVQNLVKKAAECTGCGDCLSRCPYELPIPDLIKENMQWVEERMKAL